MPRHKRDLQTISANIPKPLYLALEDEAVQRNIPKTSILIQVLERHYQALAPLDLTRAATFAQAGGD
ncbi:MAG: hypothetical protein CL923_04790 [Deltaproteobacteria bacterium]|jgi:hypothetical protein|nr:hypothetical protein [Deltaproteobacteria bacterium]MDP7157157.1 hypothetical protein [SAR324 cluster bacterium]MBQ31858.1 hypothetical protein [Deltaproteobacteria bacterium]MDP7316700.1 hypothetical protein [SAR324 cluster bacterium]MDP7463629.1 hypothetical protein [SAR324 cluster bacterium]|tara:strand:- start:333 stop:533 length:201 start_codon:yes stop_codon:yes gene_type:complete